MKFIISRPDDRSRYSCLPLADNIYLMKTPEQVRKDHPDWRLIQCPKCGRECYETGLARQAAKYGIKGLYTTCALNAGSEDGR